MTPYAELLEFNQPNNIRKEGFTRIRDAFEGLREYRDIYAPLPEGQKRGYFPEEPEEFVADPERIMEFAGRWDYGQKNAEKLGQKNMIEKWLASGEESMIEMGHATFFIECSRVVSHELVRHRLASFQQESQRFTKYEDIEPFSDEGDEMFFIADEEHSDTFKTINRWTHNIYRELRRKGVSPQLARYVLPNSMRTRMIISANIREWRHILKLRLHSSAQPEMRELMQQVYDQLIEVFPNALAGVNDGERSAR